MNVRAQVDPATEAWATFLRLLLDERPPRIPAIAAEFDLSPVGLRLLQVIEPDEPMPMSALAGRLGCDASNMTGMVDRLETRGLLERRDDARDRRVKRIALTEEGCAVRNRVLDRLHEPPEAIARLSPADQRALRDVLRRAVDG